MKVSSTVNQYNGKQMQKRMSQRKAPVDKINFNTFRISSLTFEHN